jgi:DNA-binding NarL/FixJ family response regulator
LLALLAELAVDGAATVAREVLPLARGLEQPPVLAQALIAVVAAGHGGPALLSEAYELYGGMDALLHRHRLRQLMRGHDVVVPRRAATTEGDRLLATLVADGASNRELAAVLQTSTKSVEGMLTRLFARTGYRSRVDLAAAVLTGGYG